MLGEARRSIVTHHSGGVYQTLVVLVVPRKFGHPWARGGPCNEAAGIYFPNGYGGHPDSGDVRGGAGRQAVWHGFGGIEIGRPRRRRELGGRRPLVPGQGS